jgi:GNAT superfamily N-acetyltransferase
MADVVIKTGKENMDVNSIHRFLTEDSYWAKGISIEMVDRALTHSFCIGAFVNGDQIAFGRVITDYYTFGWIADIYVLPECRGQGISKKMLTHLFDLPWSKRLRRIMLNTKDAHGLYRQFQFKDLKNPSFLLEVHRTDIHLEYSKSLQP